MSYSNGKSAGRLALPTLNVKGVHRFGSPGPTNPHLNEHFPAPTPSPSLCPTLPLHRSTRTNSTTFRTIPPTLTVPTTPTALTTQGTTTSLTNGAVVLHYPWCDFERWAAKARRDLASHGTKGLGFYEEGSAVAGSAADGAALEAYYLTRVVQGGGDAVHVGVGVGVGGGGLTGARPGVT